MTSPRNRVTASLVGVLLLTGCALVELSRVRHFEQAAAQYARIGGTVRTEADDDAWIVVYVTTVPCSPDFDTLAAHVNRGDPGPDPKGWTPEARALLERVAKEARIARHVTLQRTGYWSAVLAPGCYGVGAYEDRNRNLRLDDEPVASATAAPGRLFRLSQGEKHQVDLVIPADARVDFEIDTLALSVMKLEPRAPSDQLLVSIEEASRVGEVVELSDPRFGAEMARTGYFDVWAFLWHTGVGLYFLEPYDPDRIPVLFVHGAQGHPQEFEALIERLDRTRYQPWIFHYPSGARLQLMADTLSEMLASLQLRLAFDELAVVAHSMGGLVSRACVLRLSEQVTDLPVGVLVTVATPWGGIGSASAGVERSPYVVPAWRDLAVGAPFLEGLFFRAPAGDAPRHLPDGVDFHLLFAVDDQTVDPVSATRWEAIREARDRWPLSGGHSGVLRNAHTATVLNEILDRHRW